MMTSMTTEDADCVVGDYEQVVDFSPIGNPELDILRKLPELVPYLFASDVENYKLYNVSAASIVEPDIQSTNCLVWFHKSWSVVVFSVLVNIIQLLLLLFIGYSASTDDQWLDLKLSSLINGGLIFFVIPTMCLFLSIKRVAALDPFLKEKIVIRQLVYTDTDLWLSTKYLLGLVVLIECFNPRKRIGWTYRFAILREVAIIVAVMYATITLALIKQAPLSVMFRFYTTLFVLDFDEILFKLLFPQFKPKAVRRQYGETEPDKAETFAALLDRAKFRLDIAYTVQLFVALYIIILFYIMS